MFRAIQTSLGIRCLSTSVMAELQSTTMAIKMGPALQRDKTTRDQRMLWVGGGTEQMPISSTLVEPMKAVQHTWYWEPLYAMASARQQSTTHAVVKAMAQRQLSVSPINDCAYLDACK